MALRGFSCSNCHTWFEGEGNHPRCPVCGTRASPRDLLDARQRAGEPVLADYDVPVEPAPDFEFPQAGGDETFRVPDYEAPPPPPDFEVPSRSQPDYEVPQRTYNEPQAPPAPAPRRHQDESLGNRLSPFIGVLIFLLIIASQVCRALTESG